MARRGNYSKRETKKRKKSSQSLTTSNTNPLVIVPPEPDLVPRRKPKRKGREERSAIDEIG